MTGVDAVTPVDDDVDTPAVVVAPVVVDGAPEEETAVDVVPPAVVAEPVPLLVEPTNEYD